MGFCGRRLGEPGALGLPVAVTLRFAEGGWRAWQGGVLASVHTHFCKEAQNTRAERRVNLGTSCDPVPSPD